MVWKIAQMHQNTFFTTPDGQKYLFSEHFSGDLEVCENASKHVFNHSRRFKNIFFEKKILLVRNYAQMHQNTFLTTSDVQNDLFWKKVFGGLEVCDNASKHVFNHYGRSKISFLKKVSGGLGVCANASWLKTCFDAFAHTPRPPETFFKKDILERP